MAEFVEFRSEEWASELAQMERIHLFEPKEVKTIARKRKELEYKIQRIAKNKKDYLKYIQFEIDLQRLIKGRRQKTGIQSKVKDIENKQTQRIIRLFRIVIFRFPNDLKLWMSFFKFCEDVKVYYRAGQMIVRMLQIHSHNPDLWIFAADWALTKNKSFKNAREYLMKGLRHHPTSVEIHTHLFELELKNIKMLKKRKELRLKAKIQVESKVCDNIIEGKLLDIVYKSSVKAITDASFKVSLLNIAKKYKDSSKIQNQIVEDLIKEHINEEITWDTVAREEYKGVSYDFDKITNGNESPEEEEGETDVKKTLRQRIEKSIDVYKKGIEKMNTKEMWGYYLDFLIEINEDKKSLPNFKANVLRSAFKSALSEGKLAEKHFIVWANMSQVKKEKGKELLEVLKSSTDNYPGSLKLWHSRLKHHLSRDQEDEGLQLFFDAVDKVPNSLPLWTLMIQYLQCKNSKNIEQVYERGMKEMGEILELIKPLYLEWIVTEKGIEEGRKVFDSHEMQFPPCLQLYNKMGELEYNQKVRNYKRIRLCRELAYTNFGQNNVDVWLESLKFEIRNGDPTKVDRIYKRALNSLEPEKADEFVERYNNLKNQRFKKFCEMFDIKV